MDTPAAKNEYHLNKKGFLLPFSQTAVKILFPHFKFYLR